MVVHVVIAYAQGTMYQTTATKFALVLTKDAVSQVRKYDVISSHLILVHDWIISLAFLLVMTRCFTYHMDGSTPADF